MDTQRVYADFQKLDDDNRLILTCRGTLQDLQRHGIQLREGLHLTLYTDDADEEGRSDELRADGVVHFDESARRWVATIDWNRLWHASEEPVKIPVEKQGGAA
jgi:hypothetical protein